MIIVLFISVSIFSLILPSDESIQCLDESGKAVDWFIVYKIPKLKTGTSNKLIDKGMAYLYLTSDSEDNWQLSNENIMDEETSILTKTLQPIFAQKNNNSMLHIFYNDEQPNNRNKKNKGHTKGVVATDTSSGIWLIHSVPMYPPKIDAGYSYPLSGVVYGQTFLCLSLDHDNMDTVGIQLQYNQPQIYSQSITNDLLLAFPNLGKVINRETIAAPPWYSTKKIHTQNGLEFMTFAKTRDFNEDLYEDLIAPGLQTALFVESWLNGPGKLPSSCSNRYDVNNVQEVELSPANVTFPNSLDHSKWAVSSNAQDTWICIGDINRAEHQKKRGGGAACLSNPNVAHLYKLAIASVENCKFTHNILIYS